MPPPSPTPAPPSSQSPLSTPAFLWTPAEAERRNPSSRSCAYLGDCPQWPHRLSRLSDGWVRPEPGHVTLAVHGSLVEAGAAPQDVAPGLYKCARALCRVVDVSRGSPDPPPNASLVGSDTLTWERGGAWHGAIDAFLFVTTRAEARTHTGRQPQFVAHWDPIAAADLRPPSDKALVNNERSWYGTPQWRIHWEGELGHLPPPPEGVEFAREIPSSTNPYSEAALRLRGTPWEARSRDDLLAIVHSADTCSAALALAAKSGVRVVVAGAVKCGPWSPRAGAAKAALQGDQSVAAAAAPACDALPRTWNSTGPTPAFAWGGEVRVLTECLMHAHRYCLIIDPPSSAPGYASPLLWAALRSGCVPAYVERNGTLREPDLRALLPVPDAGVFVTANDSSAALRLLATELGDRTAYAKRMAWKEQPAGEWQGGFRAALTRSVATAYCDVCDTVETTPNLRAVATPRDGESIWLQPCVRTFFDEAVFRVDRAKSQSGWAAAAGIDRTYVTHYSRSNARRGRTTERLASVGLEADWILGGDSDDFRHNASLFRCLFHGSHADAIEFSRNIFSILPVATSLVIKHIFAAYDMVKRNYSAVLVLEDDVLPSANFTTDLAVAVASLNAEAPSERAHVVHAGVACCV